MFLAISASYVKFGIKFIPLFFLWALKNLFFVCVAEEALFRGFIQRNLETGLKNIKFGSMIALFIAAFLFGLAHYKGGVVYILLAFIAGIGYGFAYKKTKHIEASILTHFSLNAVHFLFFTSKSFYF